MDRLLAQGWGDAETLFALWERGLAHVPSARGEAMLEQLDADQGAAATIGARNRRLIDLHARLFGDELELISHCPGCNAAVQFASRCRALTGDLPVKGDGVTGRVELMGYQVEFRLPTRSDVAMAASGDDEEAFARRLLDRCVVTARHGGSAVSGRDLPDVVIDAVSRRMETLDPAALLTFALECPECSRRWIAPLDVDHLLWTKVQAATERLLLDIDALARVYGWTEREVLALNPIRRAAYVQLAGA